MHKALIPINFRIIGFVWSRRMLHTDYIIPMIEIVLIRPYEYFNVREHENNKNLQKTTNN